MTVEGLNTCQRSGISYQRMCYLKLELICIYLFLRKRRIITEAIIFHYRQVVYFRVPFGKSF